MIFLDGSSSHGNDERVDVEDDDFDVTLYLLVLTTLDLGEYDFSEDARLSMLNDFNFSELKLMLSRTSVS